MDRKTHPHFVANDAAGSRRDTATLLVGTAREYGISQRDIASTHTGYYITDALAKILYADDDEPAEADTHDADDFPLYSDKEKPDDWTSYSDEEKRAYVYHGETPATEPVEPEPVADADADADADAAQAEVEPTTPRKRATKTSGNRAGENKE